MKFSCLRWAGRADVLIKLHAAKHNRETRVTTCEACDIILRRDDDVTDDMCVQSNWQKHHYISLYILYIHVFHLVSIAVCLTCSLVTSAPHSFSQCSSGLMLLTAHRHEQLQVFWSFSKIFELNLVLNVFKFNIRLCELYSTSTSHVYRSWQHIRVNVNVLNGLKFIHCLLIINFID